MKDSFAWPYPRHVAHRGGGSLAPENTLAAFRVGVAHGYRMAECDAKLSGDGTLVLMHDDTVDRTTNGRGRVAGMTWGELARLDAGASRAEELPQYSGEPVPTLEAVARYCLANAIALNIEIKPCPGRERETGAAVAIEVQRIWRGDALPPLISSFKEAALEAALEFAPRLPRALLQSKLTLDWPDRLARLDCVALDVNYRELTPEIVLTVLRYGYRVACYTPNDPAIASELVRWGVDCIITDALDRIPPDG
ncbi:MAG: glycerophosphodiester phosphodiesterase [Betaproteobacteria bacterium]